MAFKSKKHKSYLPKKEGEEKVPKYDDDGNLIEEPETDDESTDDDEDERKDPNENLAEELKKRDEVMSARYRARDRGADELKKMDSKDDEENEDLIKRSKTVGNVQETESTDVEPADLGIYDTVIFRDDLIYTLQQPQYAHIQDVWIAKNGDWYLQEDANGKKYSKAQILNGLNTSV